MLGLYIYICTCTCTYTYKYLCIPLYTYTYIYMYIHLHTYVYIYIYTYTYMYIYIYVYVHMSVHIYIYTHAGSGDHWIYFGMETPGQVRLPGTERKRPELTKAAEAARALHCRGLRIGSVLQWPLYGSLYYGSDSEQEFRPTATKLPISRSQIAVSANWWPFVWVSLQ